MSQLPVDPPPNDFRSNSSDDFNSSNNSNDTPGNPPLPDKSMPAPADDLGPADQVQWFGRPDASEKPLGFWRLVVITLSGHIGVRPRAKRHEDFRRANGLHVFIAAIVYFFLVIAALIVLVNMVASR